MSRLGRLEPVRGLPSLNESRETRRRQTRSGKAFVRGMPPVVWLWLGVAMAVFAVAYWRITAGQLESQKSAVMAKQRAVRKSLGPKLLPFIERVEAWTKELAAAKAESFTTPYVEPRLEWEKLARKSSVYLRILQSKATTEAQIRRSSALSLNDGFTSCFFIRDGVPDPTQGPKCVTSADCQAGLLCNEWDVCSVVSSPYNLRLTYRGFRILSEDFTRNIQDATDELEVRAYDRELDQITKVDVPVAIEVLQRAKVFAVVIDEIPPGFDAHKTLKQGEPLLSEEQRIQGSEHNARIGIWDTESGKQLVRFRGAAFGRLVAVGRRVELDAELEGSRTRQANSCFLATTLRGVIQRLGVEPEISTGN
jgi:hypothetical protein